MTVTISSSEPSLLNHLMCQPAPAHSDKNADSDASSLYLDKQLCFALYATSLAMTKVYRPLLSALGITYPQYLVMLALWEHGELSVGQLGKQVALDSGTLVPLIRKLSALELILRRRNPEDDRSVLVTLTPRGSALSQQAHAVHDKVACATQCTEAQRQTLVRSLQNLRASLLETAAALSQDGP